MAIKSYYMTKGDWSRSVGWGTIPQERKFDPAKSKVTSDAQEHTKITQPPPKYKHEKGMTYRVN